MLDNVHSTLQFPMVILLYVMGFTLIFQGRRALLGLMHKPSAWTMFLLGAFFIAFGARQTYWHLRWALRANDLDAASDALLLAPWAYIPVALNVISLLAGIAALVVIGRAYMGRKADVAVVASSIGLVVLGALLAGAR